MKNERPVLGIWGYSSDMPDVLHHDSGAAIVVGGEIVAAVNEERISRKKNEGRWPARSIDEVIRIAGIARSDIGAIAMAGRTPLSRAAAMLGETGKLFLQSGDLLSNRLLYALLTAKKIRRHGPPEIDAPVSFVSHHEAHAASAFFTSPFPECAVVTLDGIGDSAHCGSVWLARNNSLKLVRNFSGYASVGLLYSAVTKAFGFKPARHEGKITGLAGHGDSGVLIDRFRKQIVYDSPKRRLTSAFIPQLFRSRIDAEWRTSWIDELIENYRREDIAAALQRHTEELCAAIVRDALKDTGMKHVALAGGVFANVRVNQKVREAAGADIWVHPNMGDGGLAAGAALALNRTRMPMRDAYLGGEPEPLTESAPGLLETKSMPRSLAAAVRDGRVVGVIQGRMEYGPRALGHRSIFVSADDPSINDSLNVRLRRTEFMPFAPIMTRAAASKYLKNWSESDLNARYMTMTYEVTDACRKEAPAVVHVDGTARPQVVDETQPAINDFLIEYGKLTGKEIVINTSFNIHEEPIVRSADDALRSWQQGAIDLVAWNKFLIGSPDMIDRYKT